MRSSWNGAITFGLVSIPIRLYPAVEDKELDLTLVHKGCGSAIKQRRHCLGEDDVVIEWNDVERVFEYAPGTNILVTEDDLDSIKVESTKQVKVDRFVKLTEVDAQYNLKPYFVEPMDVGQHGYALLAKALATEKVAATGLLTLRSRERPCYIKAVGDVLTLTLMRYPDEIRVADELNIGGVGTDAAEVKMARSLIQSMTGPMEVSRYKDSFREALLDLIERKADGQEIEKPAAKVPQSAIPSLMNALQESIRLQQADKEAEEAPVKRTRRKKQEAVA